MRRFVCCACVPDDDHHETVREFPLEVDTPVQTPVDNAAEASLETAAETPARTAVKAMTPEQALAGVIVLAVWYTYTVRLVQIFVPRDS